MKITLLAGFLLFALTSFSQLYSVSYNDLIKGTAKEGVAGEHELDLAAADWKAKAKIIITGIPKGKEKQITVKRKQQDKLVEDHNIATSEDGSLIFSIDEYVLKNTTFEIQVEENPIVKVVFDASKKTPQEASTGNPEDGEVDSSFHAYVGALASANFVGNNKFLNNLTPVINLGGVIPIIGPGEKGFSLQLDINPYVGGDIDAKDSTAIIPALMLYGKGGFVFNSYFNFELGKAMFTFMPFGFGLKFIPDVRDSALNLIQHNIRGGLSLRYSNDFLLSGMVTHGWHNLTSQSKVNFDKVFTKSTTDISYITVLAQLALRGKGRSDITNYVYFEWRSLLSKNKYPAFTNNSILTLGIRKTLELGAARGGFNFAESGNKKKGKAASRKVVHPTL